jgi:hypothetical protein
MLIEHVVAVHGQPVDREDGQLQGYRLERKRHRAAIGSVPGGMVERGDTALGLRALTGLEQPERGLFSDVLGQLQRR